jgi:hypothetical protein
LDLEELDEIALERFRKLYERLAAESRERLMSGEPDTEPIELPEDEP